MTEEEKKNADKAKAEADAKAKAEKEKADADFEASLEGLSDEEKAAKRATKDANVNNPDFKKLYEEEKTRRENAEKVLAEDRFRNSKKKREPEEDPDLDLDEEDDDKPLTKRDLKVHSERERAKIQRELQAGMIREIANDLATSPEEAEATIEIHKNRTWPSFIPLKQQIEEAHAIANRNRLVPITAELKRALKSKETSYNDASGAHRDSPPSNPKISTGDAESYRRAGFEYDGSSKLWKKKLPNGNILVKDPKTKKSYVLPKS